MWEQSGGTWSAVGCSGETHVKVTLEKKQKEKPGKDAGG